jgi:hypothetical protein
MIADLAQAVTDALNGEKFSTEFTAERVAVPDFELADMQALRVTVVPREIESSALDRARDSHEVKVDVAIQKKVASLSNDEIDPLLSLVREIAAFLNRKNMNNAVWRKTENKPVYSPEHLREMRQFTSVLTVTYEVRT